MKPSLFFANGTFRLCQSSDVVFSFLKDNLRLLQSWSGLSSFHTLSIKGPSDNTKTWLKVKEHLHQKRNQLV